MKTTIILNGKISLILQPEDAMETEIIKKLNGGTVQLVSSNMAVLQNNIDGSLLISNAIDETKKKIS